MIMADVLDMTLDELRAALAARLPEEAAFEGWTDAATGSMTDSAMSGKSVTNLTP